VIATRAMTVPARRDSTTVIAETRPLNEAESCFLFSFACSSFLRVCPRRILLTRVLHTHTSPIRLAACSCRCNIIYQSVYLSIFIYPLFHWRHCCVVFPRFPFVVYFSLPHFNISQNNCSFSLILPAVDVPPCFPDHIECFSHLSDFFDSFRAACVRVLHGATLKFPFIGRSFLVRLLSFDQKRFHWILLFCLHHSFFL
jgi:hypothetical protein